jgi:integrase
MTSDLTVLIPQGEYAVSTGPARRFGLSPQPTNARSARGEELQGERITIAGPDSGARAQVCALHCRSERANLERRDVDRARSTIRVRGTKTLRSRREVPLTKAAPDVLGRFLPGSTRGFFFAATRGGPFDVENSASLSGGRRSKQPGLRRPRGSMTFALRSPLVPAI